MHRLLCQAWAGSFANGSSWYPRGLCFTEGATYQKALGSWIDHSRLLSSYTAEWSYESWGSPGTKLIVPSTEFPSCTGNLF